MANTLKFGNGQWATGNGQVLAYNDENENFKPLPFDFARASSTTVVNQSGLIETVASGIPRIDFQDNTNGALLLEPSRTNIVDNSTNFFLNSWSGTRAAQGSTIVSPNGNDEAYKLIGTSVNNTHYREYTVSSASSGSYTGSCFFKKGEYNVGVIRMSVDSYAKRIGVYINLDNGTHLQTLTVGSPTGTSYKIQDYGNGWYRLSVSIIHTSGNVMVALSNSPSDFSNAGGLPSFLGNNSDGGYAWGAQVESGSYPTSYIPTSGSAVTRVAETCSQTVPDGVIGQTEGTMYLDFIYDHSNTSISENVSLSNGSSSNRLYIGNVFSNTLTGLVVASSTLQFSATTSYNLVIGQRYKAAISYKLNDFSFYVNGVEIGTDTSGSVPLMNRIGFDSGSGSSNFYKPTNDFKLYNTRLTNAELASLTTI